MCRSRATSRGYQRHVRCTVTRRMQHATFIDITHALFSIHGGNRARAIARGVKAAYKTVRPWIGEVADSLENVAKAAGGTWAAKETWDHFRGNNK